MVRRKTGSYPTSPSDGTQVYYDTGTSYNDTGLTAGTTYYYSAWSRAYEEGYYQYSDSYATASATPGPTCGEACSSLGYGYYAQGTSCGAAGYPKCVDNQYCYYNCNDNIQYTRDYGNDCLCLARQDCDCGPTGGATCTSSGCVCGQSCSSIGAYAYEYCCATCGSLCGWRSHKYLILACMYHSDKICLLGTDCFFSDPYVDSTGNSCSSSGTKCQHDMCPDYSGWNGYNCTVRRACTHWWYGAYGSKNTGKWDAGERKCVQCDANNKETTYCASYNSFNMDCDYDQRENAPCTGTGDGQCESACGASTECDEKNPNDSCGTGKICKSNCICEINQCNIGGVPYDKDQCNPANKCQYCDKSNPSSWSNVPSGKVCTASGVVPVSATNYCNYDEDCDAGDCYATKWYTSCNGLAPSSCRAASDHTDSYTNPFNVSNGYVLKSDCSEASPSTTLYCGTATDCTAGTCTGHKYYRACNGTGGCRIDNTYAYDQTIYASAGKVLTSTCTDQDANSTVKCAATVNKCTDGSCSGEKRYPECQAGGVCDSSATTYYTSETVYASTGYTLTSTCGTTGTTLCDYSTWNGCNGACQKKRDQLRCDASHNCAYDVGDDFSYLSTDGKVCSAGSEVAPSSSINCDKTIDCLDNACSAVRYYRGCTAGATSCTETGKVSYTAWPAPSNYTISETTYKVGDTCATNQDICGYSTYNKCGGTGSPYSCQKGRDQYRCNGTGSCTQDVGDEWLNVAAGYVCSGGSEVALSCTYYCGPAGNYCTEDRYKGEFRQACGGTGSCNGSTISCNNIQDCGATSNTCSSKCQKDYTYTCSAGTCGTYHSYTNASQGYYCSGGSLINTGSCAVSAYNARSADKCDKKRDLYRCDGLGGADANCIFDVGDEWAYVSAYKIANSSGQEVDASSADNTGTCHSCTEGSCSGTYRWAECDGSGNAGPCITYNQPETVYAQTGYTLTSTCSTNGTSYCVTNLCRDGGGWHHKCSKRCDAVHNCEYWIDASCVDHCTNGIKDCDETGTDCGGSCPSCDTTPPTTTIKVKRKSTGEDLTAAGSWLRADTYTIQFEDKDQADGSGSNCENCSCEYSIYSCDVGGTNCNTVVISLTSRTPNFSFDILAGKTAPTYNLEGAGRYRIYSGAKDMAGNSAFQYRYINFDFTPPKTEFK